MSRSSTSVNGSLRSNADHRRLSLSNSIVADDHLAMMDLFSRNRRDDSSSHVKLGRLSLGSAKQQPKSGFDDLLSSVDGGKNDYDWLLTPPGTPLFPSSDGSETQPTLLAPRKSSRSVSTTKASRLSVSESENIHPARPARSSSVTRPAVSSTKYSTYSKNGTSILNTSSASVSSYIRPSTPTARSSAASRPSTPPTRSTPSRSSTPSRVRPSPPSSTTDRPRPSTNSRPSTPTSRPQTPANLSSPVTRTVSRPSTPTRRSSAPSLSTGPTTSVSRNLSNGSRVASVSRPSSPSPRIRPPPQPLVLPDFPLETPPNLRTTLPDRPLSAGRSRPGSTLTVKGIVETQNPAAIRRQSSPVVTRGRLTEPNGRGRVHANGQVTDTMDSHKASHVLEASTRKPVKASPDSTGFGRTISKKSLDMAIRHMDVKNGTNGTRPVMNSSLFPQSIRSANSRSQPGRSPSGPASLDGNMPINDNRIISENGNYLNRYPENVNLENKYPISSRLTAVDMYESSRYDAILLKEDLKDTHWLHNADDNSDQGPIFDNGYEHLPEPFGPL